MRFSKLASGLSPETRAAIYHFTVYFTGSAAAVAFAIWMANRGITTDQIGIINAVPVFVMLTINLFIGRIADKASDWRQMIIVLSVFAGIASFGLFFVNGFWGILIVWTLLNVPSGSIPPVIDAATLRMTQRNGTDFGAVRAWGTVGYVFATAVAGVTIYLFGEDAFVPLIVVLSVGRAILAFPLPRFRAPAHEPTLAQVNPSAGRLREVMKPWFILPIIAFGLIQSAHAILGSFAALVWMGEGIAEIHFGALFAVAAGAEAVMMFAWKRIGKNITARHMILAAALVTVFRWTVMAFSPPVAVLYALQCLHAITYAVGYFGMVKFVANWTSEDIAAEAQGFAFMLQQAITVVVLIGFGWLVGFAGPMAFLSMAVLGVISAICVTASLIMRPGKTMPAR